MGDNMTRRTVLYSAGAVGAVAASAATLAACGSSSSSSSATTGAATATAGTTSAATSASTGGSTASGTKVAKADVPVGGGKIGGGVVVTQPTSGTFKAFSSTCTHQGCTVGEVSENKIICPCHNSAFDASSGAVLNGPATRALPAKSVTVSGDTLIVS